MASIKIKQEMIIKYGNVCWMAYKLTPENQYTFHHIFEARKGGQAKIENGAILTRSAHCDLNEMDKNYKECYRDLNILFTLLNGTKKSPSKEYFIELKKVLLSASKRINLSKLYNPNIDPNELADLAYVTSEEGRNPNDKASEIILLDYESKLNASKEYNKSIEIVSKNYKKNKNMIAKKIDKKLIHKMRHKNRHNPNFE